MLLGWFFDDLCVLIGVIVIWFARGCKYSLKQELKEVKTFDFWNRCEGIIGLATILVIGGLVWGCVHFLR
jgi:hypothetical protein